MDFFSKLGKKASETYKYTADKTSRLAKETKIKIAMNENKAKVEELYVDIGKEVYQNFIREEKVDLKEILTHKCEEIDLISSEIDRQREEILALNNKKQCENCYTEISIKDNFCPNCGASQTDSQEKSNNDNKEDTENKEIIELKNEEEE